MIKDSGWSGCSGTYSTEHRFNSKFKVWIFLNKINMKYTQQDMPVY